MVEEKTVVPQEDQVVKPSTPAIEPTPVESKVEVVGPVTPAGDSQTPLKTPEEPEVTKPVVTLSAQARIDKMYARLQGEREKRIRAENDVAATKLVNTGIVDDDDEVKPTTPALTEADVKRILDSDKRQKQFEGVETGVLLRHPTALNEDGSFNLDDPFCKKYIEIGKRNPQLAAMVDGPMLAEAQAEKELGISYQQGRVDEANNVVAAHNAHTSVSKIIPPKATKTNCTETEKKMAARYGMTEQQYLDHKAGEGVRGMRVL